MSDMKLAVLGAAGRMGQTLARAVAATPGCVLAAGIEAKGSPAIGQDLGEVAGLGTLGIAITDDPLPVFAEVHGVLDFTTPKATVAFAGLAAQARIVHVIGTTGFSAERPGQDRSRRPPRGNRQGRQYEPWRQSARWAHQ